MKPVVEVIVEKNRFQIRSKSDLQNYVITQTYGYEGGCPTGLGYDLDEAVKSFKYEWLLHNNEEIEVKVIETKIV